MSGSIQVSFEAEDARRRFSEIREWSSRAAHNAQLIVARELLKDAKLFVPVLTGALKDSGRVETLPAFDDTVTVVRTIFGSADVVYAALQHDNETYWHPSLGFRGATKFLERPLLVNREFYLYLFLAEYRFALNRLQ